MGRISYSALLALVVLVGPPFMGGASQTRADFITVLPTPEQVVIPHGDTAEYHTWSWDLNSYPQGAVCTCKNIPLDTEHLKPLTASQVLPGASPCGTNSGAGGTSRSGSGTPIAGFVPRPSRLLDPAISWCSLERSIEPLPPLPASRFHPPRPSL